MRTLTWLSFLVSLPWAIASVNAIAFDPRQDPSGSGEETDILSNPAGPGEETGILTNPAGEGSSTETEPSATSSADTPGMTPFLYFNTVPTMTSCEPATVAWVYAGPSIPMTLAISNIGVDQTSSSPSPESSTISRSPTFSNEETIFDARFKRADIIKTSGGILYLQETLSTTIDPFSDSFTWDTANVPQGWYVLNANISSSAFRSRPFFVAHGRDTSCVIEPPQPSSTPSSPPATSTGPSQTDIAFPVDASDINTGAIAGGVIGGVALVAIVVGAYLFLRFAPPSRRARSSSARPAIGNWGNLGSFDSSTRAQPKRSKSWRKHESLGPINLPPTPAPPRSPYDDEDEEKLSNRSPYSDTGRSPFSDSGHSSSGNSPVVEEVGMIPIVYDPTGSRGGRHSTSSSLNANANVNYSRPRSYSYNKMFPESVHNSTATFPDSLLSTPAQTPTPTPTGDAPKRKTPRKPVPSYIPDDLSGTPPDHMPLDAVGEEMEKAITHKGSEGSIKKMHYLIPDMPPPQND